MADESSHTASPIRALSRLRRNHDGRNDSSNSLIDSSNSDDPGTEKSTRASIESGVNKIKDHVRRRSTDDRSGRSDSQTAKRLSKLVPHRRRKGEEQYSEEVSRHSSFDSGNVSLALPGNRSGTSLADQGSGRSSLFTDDGSDDAG